MSEPTVISLPALSFDYDGAAAATGYSPDVIRRAADAGEIERHYPEVGLKQLSKPVIDAASLLEWVRRGDADRRRAS